MFLRCLLVGTRRDDRVPSSRKELKVLIDLKGNEKGDGVEDSLVKDVPQFCFPESPETYRDVFSNRQFATYYPIILTTGNGERVYGFCLRTRRVGKGNRHDVQWRFPVVLAILSRNPDHRAFRSILSILTPYLWNSDESLRHAINKIIVSTNPAVILNQRMCFSHVHHGPPDAHASSILERFESEDILKLLGAMLAERRVLIIGKHFVSVARCVIASISMLYPFRWQHVLLPVVPDHLIALTLSPMPYILGMRSSQYESLGIEYGEALGVVVVANLDQASVRVVSFSEENQEPPPPALDTKQPSTGLLKRHKHGAFNCVRLRRDIRAIRNRVRSSQQVKGRIVLGEDEGEEEVKKRGLESVKFVVKGLEHRMGIYRNVIGVSEQKNLRTSLLTFFVRIFSKCERYVRRDDDGVSGTRRKFTIDLEAFAKSQPDRGVREMILAMEGSQLMERFVQSLKSYRESEKMSHLTCFMNAMKVYREDMDWSSAKDAVYVVLNEEIRGSKNARSSLKSAKSIQSVLLRLTSNQAMEDQADEFLKFVLNASFDEKLYECVWPVLMMRLNDGSGSQYRHAMKSLALIRHLLIRGSLRILTDIHIKLNSKMTEWMLNHENVSVRAQAIEVYRLSNDASFYRRCRRVEKERKKKKKDSRTRVRVTSSTTFMKLHKSMRPSKMLMKRPVSMLLDLDDADSLRRDDSFWGDITTSSSIAEEKKKKKDNSGTVIPDLMDIFGETDKQEEDATHIRVEEKDPFDVSQFFDHDESSNNDGDAFANFDDEWDLPPIA